MMVSNHESLDMMGENGPRGEGWLSGLEPRGNLSLLIFHFLHSFWYCWWTKSCTTKDDDYPIIYRVLTIPVGAGFRPSTVAFDSYLFFFAAP